MLALDEGSYCVYCCLQEGTEEDDDRWVMEQVGKGARSVPSASAISNLNLNGRYSLICPIPLSRSHSPENAETAQNSHVALAACDDPAFAEMSALPLKGVLLRTGILEWQTEHTFAS